MKKFSSPILWLLAISVFTLGCSSKYGDELQYGVISLAVTDAPFPYDYISETNVTITKVEVRAKDSTNRESPFKVLFKGETSINLLELNNGITKSLGDTEVPVGSYDLVRMYVSDANVVLKNGMTFNLQVPGGSDTGIKLFIKPEIVVSGGASTALLLDFDISRSFLPKGNSNDLENLMGFVFKPVVKAVNQNLTGTLSGNVTTLIDTEQSELEGVQIGVMAADTLNTVTYTDASGAYTILGLEAGTYTIQADKMGYTAQTAEEVAIALGKTTTHNFKLIAE